MSRSTRTVTVAGERPYGIHIGPGLLADGVALAAPVRGGQALIVSDDTVAPLYADRLETALRGARPELSVSRFILPAGEASKTLDEFGRAIDALAALGARRDDGVLPVRIRPGRPALRHAPARHCRPRSIPASRGRPARCGRPQSRFPPVRRPARPGSG